MKKIIIFTFIGLFLLSSFSVFANDDQSKLNHSQISWSNSLLREIQSQLDLLKLKIESLVKSENYNVKFENNQSSGKNKEEDGSEKDNNQKTLANKPILEQNLGYVTLDELPGNMRVSCLIPELKFGSNNKSVYLLQMILKQEGSYPEGLITGYFGKLTEKALQAFQKSHNITPSNGQVFGATSDFLNDLVRKYYPNDCVKPVPTPTPVEEKFMGLLKISGPTTYMWGTHMLVINSGGGSALNCGSVGSTTVETSTATSTATSTVNCLSQSYLVQAANGSVLQNLKRYENNQVVIFGSRIFNNFEGGFWGIVANEVRLNNEIPPVPESKIEVYSPHENEEWKTGQTYQILWKTKNIPDSKTVTIFLNPLAPPCASSTGIRCLMMVPAPILIAKNIPNSGVYNWTIPSDLQSIYTDKVQISVSVDDLGISDSSETFIIRGLEASNNPPVIQGIGGPTKLNINETGTWVLKAYDLEGGSLYYGVDWGDSSYKTAAPQTLYSREVSQEASFSHRYSAVGIYKIVFTVSDSKGGNATSTITVNVGRGSSIEHD